MTTGLPLRIAAILLWFTAAGFGLPCVLAIRNLAAGRDIPMIMGFPAYGGGPLERHGIRSTVWLITLFLIVCVLDGLAGWFLWDGQKVGAILALAVLPAGAVFWWGFALPIPPLAALARTVLILLSWRSLK